jgi:hypothetical protein
MNLLPTALFYATERGFHVFPCRWITEGENLKAKRPLGDVAPNGCHDATTDGDTITKWWTRYPQAAIGINTGRSGLVVIDCDRNKPLRPPYDTMPGVVDGEDVLSVLAEDHGGIPWTRSVRTPSGGVHYYYTAPATGPVPPSNGKVGPMFDVKGGESYVIAAGSWADGLPYTLLDDSQPIQPLPEWLAVLCRKDRTPQRPAGPPPVFATPNGNGYTALKVLVNFVLDSIEGTRNERLWWAAWKAGSDIAKRRYDQAPALDALSRAAVTVGLTPSETRATIASGLRAAS